MKILMAYSSKTGNTKKLCEGVYQILKDSYAIDIYTIKSVESYEDYDFIIPAFWVDRGTANKEAKNFIKRIKNKKISLLGTIGASPESYHGTKTKDNVSKLINDSNEYYGVFLANGKVDPKLTKNIKFLPLPSNIKDQMYEASISSREPNDSDIRNAANFIKLHL